MSLGEGIACFVLNDLGTETSKHWQKNIMPNDFVFLPTHKGFCCSSKSCDNIFWVLGNKRPVNYIKPTSTLILWTTTYVFFECNFLVPFWVGWLFDDFRLLLFVWRHGLIHKKYMKTGNKRWWKVIERMKMICPLFSVSLYSILSVYIIYTYNIQRKEVKGLIFHLEIPTN